MVTGLIYFALFTDNLSMTIDTCLVSYKLQGFDKDPANKQAIAMLQDYNSFLKNNTKTLAGTTRLLAGFLLRDTVDQSADVDKTIRDFANYVNQVNQKDSVLMLALSKVDSYLIGNKMLQKKTDEIRNLKAIRDQLVIKSTQFMALTGNKQGLGVILSYIVSAQDQYNAIHMVNGTPLCGTGNLASAPSAQAHEISASSDLHVAFNGVGLGMNTASGNVNANPHLSCLVYDKPNLNFALIGVGQFLGMYDATQFNSILQGTDRNIGIVGVVDAANIGVVVDAAILCNILQSGVFSGYISAVQLNNILPAAALSAVNATPLCAVGSTAPLQMGLSGSPTLQRIILNSAPLQRVFSSSGALQGLHNLNVMVFGAALMGE